MFCQGKIFKKHNWSDWSTVKQTSPYILKGSRVIGRIDMARWLTRYCLDCHKVEETVPTHFIGIRDFYA